MTLPLPPEALAAVGLLGPFGIRAWWRHGDPRLIAATHIVCLWLAWAGLAAAVTHLVAADTGLVQVCEALLNSLPDLTSPAGVAVVALLVIAARGAVRAGRSAASGRSSARSVRRVGVQGDGHVVVHGLGVTAVTVGTLRPVIAVDRDRFDALLPVVREAVLDHERGHQRGRHGLVALLAQLLAAGLSPWPGARVAVAEVRRHLEASADDYAARRHGRRAVATAIASVGGALAPATGLGATGWPVWRVERLLGQPRPDRTRDMTAAGGVAAGGAVGLATMAHALVGAHLPLLVLACHA